MLLCLLFSSSKHLLSSYRLRRCLLHFATVPMPTYRNYFQRSFLNHAGVLLSYRRLSGCRLAFCLPRLTLSWGFLYFIFDTLFLFFLFLLQGTTALPQPTTNSKPALRDDPRFRHLSRMAYLLTRSLRVYPLSPPKHTLPSLLLRRQGSAGHMVLKRDQEYVSFRLQT